MRRVDLNALFVYNLSSSTVTGLALDLNTFFFIGSVGFSDRLFNI